MRCAGPSPRGLASDIHAVMGADDGGAAGLAVTVTTSHQDWLPSADRDDLRGSGLAHMLAIAGLHTAAVSGFVFFACACSSPPGRGWRLRVSGKKVAAAAALVVVAGYLILSGAHPPARRAASSPPASPSWPSSPIDERSACIPWRSRP